MSHQNEDDFNKPKIVWGNLSLNASFAKAPAGMFINAPCVMITPFNDYLLAVLNSKLGGLVYPPTWGDAKWWIL